MFRFFVLVEVLQQGKLCAHWAANNEFGFGFNNEIDQFVSHVVAVKVPRIAIFITAFDVDGMSSFKFMSGSELYNARRRVYLRDKIALYSIDVCSGHLISSVII